MSQISVDVRWLEGHHGIARWAREVVGRFPFEYDGLDVGVPRASVADALSLGRALRHRAVHFSPGYNAGARLSRATARQLLVIHDLIHLEVPEETSLAKRVYYDRVVRPAIRHAGVVITVSDFSRQRIGVWSGLPEDRIIVAPNAVSAALGVSTAALGGAVNQRPYALFVGNGKPHKRLEAAVSAVLGDPQKTFDLLIVGRVADASPEIQNRVSEAGDRIRVCTDISDEALAAAYRGAHCLLFPSSYEGFGLPALEALRWALPVVWSSDAVGGVVGDLGIYVSPRDDDLALLDGIHRAGSLPRRRGWPEACLARTRDFSWDITGRRVADAVRELL